MGAAVFRPQEVAPFARRRFVGGDVLDAPQGITLTTIIAAFPRSCHIRCQRRSRLKRDCRKQPGSLNSLTARYPFAYRRIGTGERLENNCEILRSLCSLRMTDCGRDFPYSCVESRMPPQMCHPERSEGSPVCQSNFKKLATLWEILRLRSE